MKFSSSGEFPRLYIFAIPVFVSVAILTTVLLLISPEKFPSDNARYAYSAIFQGFAAILALSVTAILITLQNMRSQRFLIEERIYKILGNRHPGYIPDTIQQIKKDITTEVFKKTFQNYVRSDSPNFNPAQIDLLVKRVIGELTRKFNFLDGQEKHEKKLRQIFIISIGLNILILIYSLTALIIVVPENYTEADWLVQETNEVTESKLASLTLENGTILYGQEAADADKINLKITTPVIKLVNANNPLGLNPFHILFVCAILVLVSLEIFAFFFVEIIKIWKLSPE